MLAAECLHEAGAYRFRHSERDFLICISHWPTEQSERQLAWLDGHSRRSQCREVCGMTMDFAEEVKRRARRSGLRTSGTPDDVLPCLSAIHAARSSTRAGGGFSQSRELSDLIAERPPRFNLHGLTGFRHPRLRSPCGGGSLELSATTLRLRMSMRLITLFPDGAAVALSCGSLDCFSLNMPTSAVR